MRSAPSTDTPVAKEWITATAAVLLAGFKPRDYHKAALWAASGLIRVRAMPGCRPLYNRTDVLEMIGASDARRRPEPAELATA